MKQARNLVRHGNARTLCIPVHLGIGNGTQELSFNDRINGEMGPDSFHIESFLSSVRSLFVPMRLEKRRSFHMPDPDDATRFKTLTKEEKGISLLDPLGEATRPFELYELVPLELGLHFSGPLKSSTFGIPSEKVGWHEGLLG